MWTQVEFDRLKPGDIYSHQEDGSSDTYIVIRRTQKTVFSLRYHMRTGEMEGRPLFATPPPSPYFITYKDPDIFLWKPE